MATILSDERTSNLTIDGTTKVDDNSMIQENVNESPSATGRQHQSIKTKTPRNDTKLCVFVNSQTPLIMRVPLAPNEITLAHLKRATMLDSCNYKYFFKTHDPEFGIVKEEINDDTMTLPIFGGRIVAWIITDPCCSPIMGSTSGPFRSASSLIRPLKFNGADDGESQSPEYDFTSDCYDDTYSDGSALTSHNYSLDNNEDNNWTSRCRTDRFRHCDPYHCCRETYASSRQLRATRNNLDSKFEANNLAKSATSNTNSNSNRNRNRNRKHYHNPSCETMIASPASCSSFSGSGSGNRSQSTTVPITRPSIISVQLHLNKFNFLGLSVRGQTDDNQRDAGIFICDIMKDSVLAQDGRLEPGDQLILVNDQDIRGLTNEEAVNVLKSSVSLRGPIRLVIKRDHRASVNFRMDARSLSEKYKSKRSNWSRMIRKDPMYPINTDAWVSHNLSVLESNVQDQQTIELQSKVQDGSTKETLESFPCTMRSIVRSMVSPIGGIECKYREWLKVPIENCFLGSEMIEWLCNMSSRYSTTGTTFALCTRRQMQQLASELIKCGYVRNAIMAKCKTFSQRYYFKFTDLAMATMITTTTNALNELDSRAIVLKRQQLQLQHQAATIASLSSQSCQ